MTRVRGVEEAMRRLLAISDDAEAAVSTELVAAALDVQKGARELLTSQDAVDTGRLRNSVAVAEAESTMAENSGKATGRDEGNREAPNQVRPGMLAAKIGTNVEYGPHIEFGTRRMGARPYLFPAAEAARPEFLRRLRAELKRLER